MNLISGIYKITNPKGRIYIGQAENLLERQKAYKRVYHIKSQTKIYRSIIKYGWNAHTWEIQEFCTVEKLNIRERYWQEFYDVIGHNGLNCKLVNTNEKHQTISEETKQKIAKTLKGRIPVNIAQLRIMNIGRVCKPETREKIRKGNLGRINPKESILKMVKTLTGRKLSKEHIEKLKLINLGRIPTEKARKNMSNAQKGHEVSKETREKMSKSKKNMSIETKRKMSLAKTGTKHSAETKLKMSLSHFKNKQLLT